MKQKLKGSVAVIGIIIIVAITAGVLGWLFAKKSPLWQKNASGKIESVEVPKTGTTNQIVEKAKEEPFVEKKSFEIKNLKINPTTLSMKKPAELSFDFFNNGNVGIYPGSYIVDLNGGKSSQSKKTTCDGTKIISPGASCRVVYSLVYATYGTFTVSVELNTAGQKDANGNLIKTILAQITFKVVDPAKMTMISPNGGEIWNKGEVHTIAWSSAKINSKKIDLILYKGNECGLNSATKKEICGKVYDLSPTPPTALAVDIPNNGQYDWAVPGDLPAGDDYRMAIQNPNYLPFTLQSDGPFSIK